MFKKILTIMVISVISVFSTAALSFANTPNWEMLLQNSDTTIYIDNNSIQYNDNVFCCVTKFVPRKMTPKWVDDFKRNKVKGKMPVAVYECYNMEVNSYNYGLVWMAYADKNDNLLLIENKDKYLLEGTFNKSDVAHYTVYEHCIKILKKRGELK